MYRYTSGDGQGTSRSSAPSEPNARPKGVTTASRGPSAPAGGQEPIETFSRDSSTILGYSALLCFTFWNYAYGPALTLLRAEMQFSYTMLGVYTAIWSVGAVLTGVSFLFVTRWLSRAALLWCSALLASGGAALFMFGSGVGPTLTGAGILGLGGTMLLTVIQAVLSDRHGALRERALTEANIGAAACAVLAPLTLGVLVAGGVDWRAAFALPAIALAALYLRYRRRPLPDAPTPRATQQPERRRRHERLPLAGSLFASLVATSMAVEFCLVYYGAEGLRAIGLSAPAAATAMSAHYLGLLIGRIGGAIATRRPGRTVALLYASLAITTGGFLLFWLTAMPTVAVLGLLLAGVGIANLYPLALAMALGAAPGQEDQVNARSQMLGGLLVIVAPYLLGSLADRVGLAGAFAVEPILIGLCLLILITGLRARRAAARTAA